MSLHDKALYVTRILNSYLNTPGPHNPYDMRAYVAQAKRIMHEMRENPE